MRQEVRDRSLEAYRRLLLMPLALILVACGDGTGRESSPVDAESFAIATAHAPVPTNRATPFGDDFVRRRLGGESRPALPHRKHRFELLVPPEAELAIGYGSARQSVEERGGAVEFSVSFEADGASALLMRKRVALRPPNAWGRWHDLRISLAPYAGQQGVLALSAEWVRPRADSPPPPASFSRPRLIVEQPGSGPNMILISIDTLRADHLGSYDYERDTSPNIDRLAAEGVRFENAFSTSMWTLPAHASLLTGLYSSHHGAYRFGMGTPLGRELRTLPELLSQRGYETAGFTGGVYVSAALGFDQGFDLFREPMHTFAKGVSFEERVDQALEWIEARKRQPWFLFLHTYDVHVPYAPRPPFDTLFDPDYRGPSRTAYTPQHPFRQPDALDPELVDHIVALYDGGIRQMDVEVGRLADALRGIENSRETCLVLTSDHGEEFKEHGHLFHGRAVVYEELVQVPLVFWCPSLLRGGRVVHDVVSIVDVLPTLLELVGGSVPESIDGRSLLNMLRDDRQPRGSGLGASRSRSVAAEAHGSVEQTEGAAWMLRDQRYKLISSTLAGVEETALYDLREDPGETNSIHESRPDIVDRMRSHLWSVVGKLDVETGVADPQWDQDPALQERLRQLGYLEE